MVKPNIIIAPNNIRRRCSPRSVPTLSERSDGGRSEKGTVSGRLPSDGSRSHQRSVSGRSEKGTDGGRSHQRSVPNVNIDDSIKSVESERVIKTRKFQSNYIDLLKNNSYVIVEVFQCNQDDISIIKTINMYGQDILFIVNEYLDINAVNKIQCNIHNVSCNNMILQIIQEMGNNTGDIISFCKSKGISCAIQRSDRILLYQEGNIILIELEEPSIDSVNNQDNYRIYPLSDIKELILHPDSTTKELALTYMDIRCQEYSCNFYDIQEILDNSLDIHNKIGEIMDLYEYGMKDLFDRVNYEIQGNSNVSTLKSLEDEITRLNELIQNIRISEISENMRMIQNNLKNIPDNID